MIKGIVAGIGNKENNENVITPQFDASVVDFMVGGSAIVEGLQLINKGNNVMTISGTTGSTPNVGNGDIVYYTTGYKSANIGKNATNIKLSQTVGGVSNGFTYDENSGFVKCLIAGIYPNSQVKAELSWTSPIETPILTKGIVVHKGYRGEITNDIEIGSATLVYAQFVLHNNEEVTDEFNVVTTNSPLPAETIDGDTITYNLWLYSNGRKNPALYNIPAIAEHSLTCDTVLEGGVIDSNVTGITQAVNDNSSRIATTEYVENQIEHDIGYETKTVKLTVTSSSGEIQDFATLTLQRKAYQVLCVLNTTTSPVSVGNTSAEGWIVFTESLPEGFRPQKDTLTTCGWRVDRVNMVEYFNLAIMFHKNGAISMRTIVTLPNLGDYDNVLYGTSYIGWETL